MVQRLICMDVYALYCDKGMALVADDILNIKTSREGGKGEGILYLGDSENDKVRFTKWPVSIGITDRRLTPKLDCQYLIEFKKLYGFLEFKTISRLCVGGTILNHTICFYILN